MNAFLEHSNSAITAELLNHIENDGVRELDVIGRKAVILQKLRNYIFSCNDHLFLIFIVVDYDDFEPVDEEFRNVPSGIRGSNIDGIVSINARFEKCIIAYMFIGKRIKQCI